MKFTYYEEAFSATPGWPGGGSGVTIGRGYDMKSRSESTILRQLLAVGVDVATAKALSKAAGKSGQDAEKWAAAHQQLRITPAQARALFIMDYNAAERSVKEICADPPVVQAYGRTDYDDLKDPIKWMLIDLRFRGDYSAFTRRQIQKYVAENNLAAFEAAMSDRGFWVRRQGVPAKRYNERVEFLEAPEYFVKHHHN